MYLESDHCIRYLNVTGVQTLTIKGTKSLTVEGIYSFQAEDGIRDLTVTGVQTCALPILAPLGKLDAHHVQVGRVHAEVEVGHAPRDQRGDAADEHHGGDQRDLNRHERA